ncbi:MAG TPA: Fic/DOC family N-terminal domain-containing protein, partial [Planctomycetaceae bacterium]|nr:Fic/DOC family N-terminal domain-containing protein [Planctomycetaceae bacterium]
MDPERFGPNRSGTLVRIDVPKKDWAFVPHEMPPQWTFNPSLWPLLADAKEALGTLNGIGQTLPDAQLLLFPLQNREAITSSSIEGTFVTPEQLLLYELNQREPKSPSDKAADWREVFNYGQALRRGCELLKGL